MITWIMCDNNSTFITHLFPVCHNLRPMTWQSPNWFSVMISSILPTYEILWNLLWWSPVWNGEHSLYTAFPSAYFYCCVECYLFRVRAPDLTRRSLPNGRAACVCHREFFVPSLWLSWHLKYSSLTRLLILLLTVSIPVPVLSQLSLPFGVLW